MEIGEGINGKKNFRLLILVTRNIQNHKNCY